MTKLFITTITTHYIDAANLCNFLSEKMGKNIEYVGSPNDIDYSEEIQEVEADGSTTAQYLEEDVFEFVDSGTIDLECGSFYPALYYAAIQGWIEFGNYVVRVCW